MEKREQEALLREQTKKGKRYTENEGESYKSPFNGEASTLPQKHHKQLNSASIKRRDSQVKKQNFQRLLSSFCYAFDYPG
jgi:hypothetical protein